MDLGDEGTRDPRDECTTQLKSGSLQTEDGQFRAAENGVFGALHSSSSSTTIFRLFGLLWFISRHIVLCSSQALICACSSFRVFDRVLLLPVTRPCFRSIINDPLLFLPPNVLSKSASF